MLQLILYLKKYIADYYGIGGLNEFTDGNYLLLSGSGSLVKVDGTNYSEIDGISGSGRSSIC